jgi:hypothetical protein
MHFLINMLTFDYACKMRSHDMGSARRARKRLHSLLGALKNDAHSSKCSSVCAQLWRTSAYAIHRSPTSLPRPYEGDQWPTHPLAGMCGPVWATALGRGGGLHSQ